MKNESKDGFELIAPVKSYTPNSIGIYDMLGNVWEITSDLFNVDYYKELDVSKEHVNPKEQNKAIARTIHIKKSTLLRGGRFYVMHSIVQVLGFQVKWV